MSRIFLSKELEGIATFWRIYRGDGIALGFTSHDHDLWFGGILHRAAPGMVPSSIASNASLDEDSAEVEGALSHDSISEDDLSCGRFDGAVIEIGAVDWENRDHAILYRGNLGRVTIDGSQFSAQVRSVKSVLDRPVAPLTSPLCRARFCGPGCTLSSARFTYEFSVDASDADTSRVSCAAPDPGAFLHGELRWLDGPIAGRTAEIVGTDAGDLVIDPRPHPNTPAGTRVRLREGCDHTLTTCRIRYANAVNFQGEPFLPGNDLLARYPTPR